MRIVCPHCTTSYAVDAAAFGDGGRTVRCARCKQQWLARPAEEPVHAEAAASNVAEHALVPALVPEPRAPITIDVTPNETPLIDSPSIASELPGSAAVSGPEIVSTLASRNRAERKPRAVAPVKTRHSKLPALCAMMGALVVTLVIWRTDVVRLLPQTAIFFKAIGLQVNLRGMAFKDVKVASETVEGKPVLVIEGAIAGEGAKALDLPRLRFAVRDHQGQEIYAWNAILDQASLKPGEKAYFRSRLAEPPAEGRSIDVRFFNKRDLATPGGKT